MLPKAIYAQGSNEVKMKVTNNNGEIINVVSQTYDLNLLSKLEIKQIIDSNNLKEGDTLTIHQ